MIKKITIVLGLISTSIGALTAQTTIPSGSQALPILPDSARFAVINLTTSSVNVPTRGANQTWNYSNVSSTIFFNSYFSQPDNNPNYPNATALNIYNPYLGSLALNNSRAYYQVNANGIFYLGYQTAIGSYSIGSVTGNNADSLKALSSVNNVNSNNQTLKLPLNFGDTWSTNYTESSDFLLTYTAVGLINAPVQIKQTNTSTDSIVGWGNLTIGGNGYNQIPALLLDSKNTIVDSFFLNGQPAPALLLGALGLTQGSVRTFRSNEFYVYDPMEVKLRSALYIETDLATNSVVSFCSYDRSTFKGNVSVKNASLDLGIKLFPNPAVQSNIVTLSFKKPNTNNLNLEIHSIGGQLVKSTVIPENTNQISLDLSEYAEGMYFVRLLNEQKQVVFYEKVIR